MKWATLILLVAIIGKISAVPIRYAYYRAAAEPQQQLEAEEDEDVGADDDEVSDEETDFTNNVQDDDDDDEEYEKAPPFTKLFPLPSSSQPGYNLPLSSMMSEIDTQGWNVRKAPHGKESQRGRSGFEIVQDDDEDDDDDDDEEDEEEDDEPEDDLPDYQQIFPNLEEGGHGPPSEVVDTSSQPELPQFRSSVAGSRVVYVPARQLQQMYSGASTGRQYVVRQPTLSYSNAIQSYSQRQPQLMATRRSPQQYYYYMPVRRNYNPYVSNWSRNVVSRY